MNGWHLVIVLWGMGPKEGARLLEKEVLGMKTWQGGGEIPSDSDVEVGNYPIPSNGRFQCR